MRKKHVKSIAIMAIISLLFSFGYIDGGTMADNSEKADSKKIKNVELCERDSIDDFCSCDADENCGMPIIE